MKRIRTILIAVISVLAIFGTSTLPAVAEVQTDRYVALGDSVPAGAGLPLQDSTPESTVCGRSGQAYPVLVGQDLGMPVNQYACGRATVPQGILGAQTTGGITFAPQLEQALKDTPLPTHISLTVGTNDIHWSEFINKCYTATCGSWQDTAAVLQLQYKLFQDLRSTVEQVRQQYATTPPPQMVLTGYFQPLSLDAPACGDTQGLTREEIRWIRLQDHILNGVIQTVASWYDFTRYASVNFTGHELCTADPWVQGLAGPAAYHPTAAGQRAIADATLAAFRQ